MAGPDASSKTYLKSSASSGQPCRRADSAPGSSWTAGRPRTPTQRLRTNEQGMRFCSWFSGQHIPACRCARPSPPSPLPLLGFPGYSRQPKVRPRTVGTKLKKNTMMLGNVEVIFTYNSWGGGWVFLSLASKKDEPCLQKKRIIYLPTLIPPLFTSKIERRGCLWFYVSSKRREARTASVPGQQPRAGCCAL